MVLVSGKKHPTKPSMVVCHAGAADYGARNFDHEWVDDVEGCGGGVSGTRARAFAMSRNRLIEYADASAEVRAVYDDIMATRGTDRVNNFWKALANDPQNLQRIWSNIKQVMAPGALDPLTKELLYLAVSVTNGCRYCIASHGAAATAKGMTAAEFGELMAVVGLANETNRLAIGLDVPIDAQFT